MPHQRGSPMDTPHGGRGRNPKRHSYVARLVRGAPGLFVGPALARPGDSDGGGDGYRGGNLGPGPSGYGGQAGRIGAFGMDYDDLDEDPPGWCCSVRLSLGLMGFIGFLSVASQRVAMDIGVICMLNQTGHFVTQDGEQRAHVAIPIGWSQNRTTADGTMAESGYGPCGEQPWLFPSNLTLVPKEGEFDWSQQQQTVIFGTYLWGFIVSQIPAGWMASRLGPRFVWAAFMVMTSSTTVLIPLAARTHYFILILMRFIGGVGAGGAVPCMFTVWGKWAPPDERTRLVALCFSGMMLGRLVAYPLSAVLCRVGFDGGWPSIFYLLGSIGVLWSVVWVIFAYDSPMVHPRISKEEKQYIMDSLAGEVEFMPTKHFSMPWFKCFTSLPFLAIIVCSFTYEWAFYTFSDCIPLYMKLILSFDIKKDPVLSGIPFAGLWFLIIVSGFWGDKLRSRDILPTGTTRKIMQCMGSLGPAGLMVGLGFLNCRQSLIAVPLFTVAFALCGFQFSGFLVSHLDIAPRYAGVLIGISSCLGSMASVGGRLLVEIITSDNTKEQWQTVFFIAATFLGFGGLCFTVCGSGELQRWAYCDDIDLATEYSSEISDSYSEPSPDDDQDLAFESAEESPPRAKPDQPPRRHRRRSSARRSASDRKHSHNHIEDMSNGTTPQTPVEDRKPSAASHHSRKRSLPRSVDLELQRTSHSEEPRYGIEGLSESIV